MTHEEARSPLRIFVTGFRLAIGEVCEALAAQSEIEFVGAATHVAEAAWALRGDQVDVVVHFTEGDRLPREDLAQLREHTPAPIVLLALDGGPGLLEEALESDVADVALLPQQPESIVFAIRKASRFSFRETPAGEQARTITVFSPKGGTGKTVVSTNLVASLARHDGKRTLLLDLDLQFGDAAIMLGIEPKHTLHDLVTAPGELDAGKLQGYLTRHGESGCDLLAAPLRPEDGELVTEAKIERLLEVARESYDVIVVDTSPFFHGPMLSTLDRTEDLLIVCGPEVPTLKNVRLGLETLKLLAFPQDRIRLVLNRSNAEVGMRRAEVEGALAMPVNFELPSVADVPAAVNRGMPLVLVSPSSEFALAVRQMSRCLVDPNGVHPEPPSEAGEQPAVSTLVKTVRGLATGWLPTRNGKRAPDPAERTA